MNQDLDSPRDHKLPALIPWLTRVEPRPKPFRTLEIQPVYEAAVQNIQRGDALIQTIAIAFYSICVARGGQTGTNDQGEVDIEDFYAIGLGEWQNNSDTVILRNGVNSILSAFLVQAWTTFETLAADLWEVAVNVHPTILAELNGESQARRVEKGGKKVDLYLLQKHGYDLRTSMGTILRRSPL